METLKAILTALGSWGQRYIGGMFMEPKNGDGKMYMSIGRVCLAVILIVMIWFWYKAVAYEGSGEMPSGLMEVFYVFAGYVFGGKVVEIVKGKLGADPPK